MKKVCFVLLLTFTLVMLCSCSGYVNNYSATILITSCEGDEANMEFDKFKERTNLELSPVELHFIENFEREQKKLKK